MKIVLLAAGRSVRMSPLPGKNFLQFLGKPLIEHQLSVIKKTLGREIIIVGGTHNLAQLKKLPATIVEQKNLEDGMAGAVLAASRLIGKSPFVVMSSNDVIDEAVLVDFKEKIRTAEGGLLLAQKVTSYFPGGYLVLNKKRVITGIMEKPGEGKEPSKLVNIVVHYHRDALAFFAALKKVATSRDDRYEQALQILFDTGYEYRAVECKGFWQPIKYPWHVLKVMEHFLGTVIMISFDLAQGKLAHHDIKIASSAKISGNVYMAPGVRMLDNAVIVGPAYIGRNTVIATNALVRQSHIGDNCVVGFSSEVARSYLGNHVWTHTNYVGDSIIGDNVSFGSGTVTGNLRLDEGHILSVVGSDKIDTQMNKLGLITGSDIRVGINVSFMPGVKIGSGSFISGGITVAQDVPAGVFVKGETKLIMKPNRLAAKIRFLP